MDPEKQLKSEDFHVLRHIKKKVIDFGLSVIFSPAGERTAVGIAGTVQHTQHP